MKYKINKIKCVQSERHFEPVSLHHSNVHTHHTHTHSFYITCTLALTFVLPPITVSLEDPRKTTTITNRNESSFEGVGVSINKLFQRLI